MSLSPTTSREILAPAVGERLLLGAIRDWAGARSTDSRPNRRVAQALACQSSDRVAGLFIAWMQTVEAALRRPIQIRCPVCGGILTDEQRRIVSCGLAGTASALGEELLKPLLTDGRSVMVLARALNAALRAEGYPLPVRLQNRPAEHQVSCPTVH
ncbi:MAG: hypothetical protein H7236_04630 [Gemmatimonadaceae bacterium]|nr:hypothetical protein [Caulobacter sp.]